MSEDKSVASGDAADSAAANEETPPTGTADSAPAASAPESVPGGGADRLRKVTDPDDEGTETGAGKPRSTARITRPVIAVLVAAAVVLLGTVGVAGYLYVQEQDTSETLAAYEEARQAACRYAPVLANYDAKNLDPYFSAVAAGATGDWKKEFETTTAELREALVAGQVVSTAGDIQCAVKQADTDSAETVVVIGQTITSLGTRGQPAPGQLSMVMRMQKIDGHWLVDQMITPLAPGPAS
jgi:Mce-associated membrane protein